MQSVRSLLLFFASLTLVALASCGGGGGTAPVSPIALTAVTPPLGFSTVPTPITLSGRGFSDPATVTIGGQSATNVVVVNATQITCLAAPGPAGNSASIEVTTSGTTITGPTFAFNDPMADLAGEWFGTLAIEDGGFIEPWTFRITANGTGNAQTSWLSLPFEPATFSLLDEPNRIYRIQGSNARWLAILSTDKRHMAGRGTQGQFEYEVPFAVQKAATSHAADGFWDTDIRNSTWVGQAVAVGSDFGVVTRAAITSQIAAAGSFSFPGATTNQLPLDLTDDGARFGQGTYLGDYRTTNAPIGGGLAILVLTPDKTFASVTLLEFPGGPSIVCGWERVSAVPQHPVVALATARVFGGGGGQTFASPQTSGRLSVSSGTSGDFITPEVTQASVGSIFATPGTSTGMAAWFALLTNGVNDPYCHHFTPGTTAVCAPGGEAVALARLVSTLTDPNDLKGALLDHVEFSLTALNLLNQQVAPPFGPFVFSYSYDGTITIFGRLP